MPSSCLWDVPWSSAFLKSWILCLISPQFFKLASLPQFSLANSLKHILQYSISSKANKSCNKSTQKPCLKTTPIYYLTASAGQKFWCGFGQIRQDQKLLSWLGCSLAWKPLWTIYFKLMQTPVESAPLISFNWLDVSVSASLYSAL